MGLVVTGNGRSTVIGWRWLLVAVVPVLILVDVGMTKMIHGAGLKRLRKE